MRNKGTADSMLLPILHLQSPKGGVFILTGLQGWKIFSTLLDAESCPDIIRRWSLQYVAVNAVHYIEKTNIESDLPESE